MTPRQRALTAILASLPALLLACTAWVQADAARKARQDERGLGDNYQSYVEDMVKRDEALQRALDELRLRLAYCDMPDGIRAQLAVEPMTVDEVARKYGQEKNR